MDPSLLFILFYFIKRLFTKTQWHQDLRSATHGKINNYSMAYGKSVCTEAKNVIHSCESATKVTNDMIRYDTGSLANTSSFLGSSDAQAFPCG